MMSSKVNVWLRWSAVGAVSLTFVLAGTRDSRAIDPARLGQQNQPKTEASAAPRLSESDQSTEVEQQRVPRDRDRSEQDAEATRDGFPQLHPPPRFSPRWLLGVRVQYLDTGARVTRVYPNTPAWLIGLEPRDIIVAIDGYQIGYVHGRLYDLQAELTNRADRSGHVRLLVQNRRNSQLLNIDVRLARIGTEFPRERGIGPSSESEIDRAEDSDRDRAGVIPNPANMRHT
jgi:hypothetical protein